MFSQIVGTVDFNSALVLCVMSIAACVIITVFIGKHRGQVSMKMQFEIDKQKLKNEDMADERNHRYKLDYDMVKLATDKEIQFRRIDTGMIEGKVNQSNYDK